MLTDVLIIGAGAAGLMCAIEAGRRGRKVIVLDHSEKIGEKIRISGGGRCNFTNIHCAPDRYLSNNPHFATSALKRYTQHDFIKMVESHGIAYHEKTLGQLFCDDSATDIIKMLLDECRAAKVEIYTGTSVEEVERTEDGAFLVDTTRGAMTTSSLVIATGGLSIPKIGATGFGYDIARQFGLKIVPTRAGLVPLTFEGKTLDYLKELSGVSIDPVQLTSVSGKSFQEAMLFTHRGISGPSVLQISSYWNPGEPLLLNLSPEKEILPWLKDQRKHQPRSLLQTILGQILPKRLAQRLAEDLEIGNNMADLSDKVLQAVADRLEDWSIKPSGNEGYRTAEVTLGGVDTDELSSKTFMCRTQPGLYFIGEVIDVTGHLGGFNFQWAWSSGWCAGQYV